jgi:hypothetical protein
MSVSKTTGFLPVTAVLELLLEKAQLIVKKNIAAIPKATKPLKSLVEQNSLVCAFAKRLVLPIMSPLELKPSVTKLLANIVLFERLSKQFFEMEPAFCHID